MSSRYSFFRLAGVTFAMLIASQAQAEDCETPVILGEKPAMEAYADYSDFLVAIMDYKARERARNYQLEQCPEVVAAAERQPPPDDPTVTLGPETLDSAVARSARLPRFDYAVQRTWYNRTTSRSFGLPGLAPSQLEARVIQTSLATEEEDPTPSSRRLALNLRGPLPATEDGSLGSELAERLLREEQSARESTVSAAFIDQPYHYTYTIALRNGGHLTLYFDGSGTLLRTSGLLVSCLTENCL